MLAGGVAVTFAVPTAIEIQMICLITGGAGNTGLGTPANLGGANEYYSEIRIWR